MCVSCVVVSIILHIISVSIQSGFTALILAAMYNKTEVAALLLAFTQILQPGGHSYVLAFK